MSNTPSLQKRGRTQQPARLKSGVPGEHAVEVIGEDGQQVRMQQVQLQLQGSFRLPRR